MDVFKHVMIKEMEGIARCITELDPIVTNEVLSALYECEGRIIFTGLGKSGIIARKISATFASTGTPSYFLHATEALHGDLGSVKNNDIVFMLSNSGESADLSALLPSLKKIGCRLILMTSNKDSSLSKHVYYTLLIPKVEEADNFNLAPTVSTTIMLTIGDALGISLMNRRDFNKDKFSLYHPAGSLGKRLTLQVKDVMRRGTDIPLLPKSASVAEAIFEISKKQLGATIITEEFNNEILVGIVTDGDIRRGLQNNKNLWEENVAKIMTDSPITCTEETLAFDALSIMRDKHVMVLPVTRNSKIKGILNILDILNLGID